MNIHIIEHGGIKIAEVTSNELLVKNVQDALDLMVDVYYQDIGHLILHEKNITPAFFDLRTGIAGEVLQKFSNYRMRLAIIGNFSAPTIASTSLRDFIYESNRQGHTIFVNTIEEALEKLVKP